jgi:UDP-N-acetylglucosamine diphosphorylase/glucosamine-1-phosphate N-acetyltransferase
MQIVLFDSPKYKRFLPLAFTRPIADFRWGILTIKEKWEKFTGLNTSCLTQDYLNKKFKHKIKGESLYINAQLLPWGAGFNHEIKNLKPNQKLLYSNGELLALNSPQPIESLSDLHTFSAQCEPLQAKEEYFSLERPWDLFSQNARELENDFELLTKGRTSEPIPQGNTIIGNKIFLEKGAKISSSIINTATGSVYLDKDAEIMEGCIVRGGLALGEGAQLKMGAKIYGASTFGPHCKVGGEVNNSILFGYSNKGHDGFLGNSVLGEWCNLGADTNNSNLKNNYSHVKVWSYESEMYANTQLQFCGLLMADHAKSGINTMFNTGTTVGVASNVFGSDFPPKFIPSFSWGGASGFETFRIEKAFEMAEKMCERRGVPFTDIDKEIFRHIFSLTEKYRQF